MDPFIIFYIGFFILIVVVVIILTSRHSKQKKQTLDELSASLGTIELTSGSTYRGELDDQIYHYQYYAGSKNNPSYLKVWVECESSGEFVLGKESKFDAISKQLGIAIEIQTGDVQFDKDFYIQTDSIEFTTNYFFNLDKRESVRKLYDMEYNLLSHNGKTMEIMISPFPIGKLKNSIIIEEAVHNLSVLSRDVPTDYYQPRILGTHAWKAKRNIVYTISGLSIGIGFAGIYWGLEMYPPLDGMVMFFYSLRTSVPAFILFIVISVTLLKGRSSSHKELLVTFFMTLFGFPMSGFGGLIVMNGYMDKSETIYHEARVNGRRYSKSKDSTSYYVSLVSWRPDREIEEIKVSYSTYKKVKSGESVMHIGTRKGDHGFEWVERYRIR
jgi:hypothetical protein